MYIPKKFAFANNRDAVSFIQNNGFGILITENSGRLDATHTPLLIDDRGETLQGHISRANPQWKHFESGKEVMAIFNGPHAYISSSWYNHENVPTWNYLAAHVYGTIKTLEGDDILSSLKSLVDKYEQHSENPVSVEGLSSHYLQQQVKGIVAFEISISKIEAVQKLSQNRDLVNYNSIIHELDKRNWPNDEQVSAEMKTNRPDVENK